MSILTAARRKVGAFFGSNSGFEGGSNGRRMRNAPSAQVHINTLLASAGPSLLARARYIARNNGYANNAVEAWAGNVIGAGITPAFAFSNKALKKRVTKLFLEWTDESDAEGLTDFYGLQRRVAREMFMAGEVFVRRRIRRQSDGLSVPFQLQILPSEMLPLSKNEPVEGGRNAIRQGIEFDGIGRRVAYHFYRVNPGDITNRDVSQETVRVPASEILHIHDPLDVGQLRGVSRYAPAIVKLFMLDLYDDAELDRKKVSALHALFVTTPGNAEDLIPGEEQPYPPRLDRGFDIQPGAVVALEPGEDIKTSSPAESGSSYEPFQYRTLLQVSAALGIPYAVLTNDMVKANYSNTRAALVEFRRRVEAFQHAVMVFLFCRPVIAWFMDLAETAGILALPGYEARRREYVIHPWLPPKFDWVDPWKDAKAEIEQINNGLKSRSQAIAERGYDAETVDEEIARDKEREHRLGLVFGKAAESAVAPNAGPPISGGIENGGGTAAGQETDQ